MTRLRTIAFWMLAAALVACHVIVIGHSLTARFWEDEAFNLTVPLNLLRGLGYASDGALSGSTLTLFDPRISTGPTVLLPVAGMLLFGGDPVISARLVPVAFWVLLIAGLVVLGIRLSGRWAALLGAAAPLAFNGAGSISPIQGPADLLGEIPAAALVVWALVAVRRRPWLAGLLVGLAVQAKLIMLLALPAFAVAVWVLAPGTGWARVLQTLKRGWLPLVMAGVPTALFELAALVSMGPARFVDHLRGLKAFVLGGGQHMEPTSVPQKLGTLAGAWFVPPVVAWLTVLVVVVLVVSGLVLVRRRGRLKRKALMLALAGAVGMATFVGWWATAAHTPLWVRHPAGGVLAFAPVLMIVAVWGAREMLAPARRPERAAHAARAEPGLAGSPVVASEPVRRQQATPEHAVRREHEAPGEHDATRERGGPGERVRRGVAVVLVGMLVASVSWSIGGHLQQTTVPRGETLATQRADVAPIAEWVAQTGTDWLAARPWGAAIAPIVMSGAHAGLFDAPSMRGVPQLTGQECPTEVLVESGRYRVCAAPGD